MSFQRVSVEGQFGAISALLRQSSCETEYRVGILYVHGLGCDSTMYSDLTHATDAIRSCPMVIPDLYGHGDSSSPNEPTAYSLEAQADAALRCCELLHCAELVVIGHSMGGPIALRAVESVLAAQGRKFPRIKALVLEESNIDGDDCFTSRQCAAQREPVSSKPEWVLWHCSRYLVEESEAGTIIPRLKVIKEHGGVAVVAVIGGLNDNKYPCQGRLHKQGFDIKVIENAGHWVCKDNAAAFWLLVDAVLGG